MMQYCNWIFHEHIQSKILSKAFVAEKVVSAGTEAEHNNRGEYPSPRGGTPI